MSGLRDWHEALRHWTVRGEVLVARASDAVVGFAVANWSFFAHCFIALVVVHPDQRRRGIASALIRHVEAECPSARLFTSTNRSNTIMQAVCESLGFVRSGIVENLDADDPELIYFKRLR